MKNDHQQHFLKIHTDGLQECFSKGYYLLAAFCLSHMALLSRPFSAHMILSNLCSCICLVVSRTAIGVICDLCHFPLPGHNLGLIGNISQDSHRQLIMYHLLFIWLIGNAAALALCSKCIVGHLRLHFEYLRPQNVQSKTTLN